MRARLDITADNGYHVLLDGREVGRGSDWRSVSEYDLTWLLPPGAHVLAVDAFNDAREAGVLAGLRIELTDGNVIEIPSDTTWRIVPEKERGWEHRRQAPPNWPHARVVGRFKGSPWAFAPTGPTLLPPLHPVELHFWNSGWFQVVLLSVCGVAVLACLQLMARLAMHTKSQKLLQRERARIARDIHDELGAGLTQLLLLGEVARKEGRSRAGGSSGIERLCGEGARAFQWPWMKSSGRLTPATTRCGISPGTPASTPSRFLPTRRSVAGWTWSSDVPPLPFELPVRRNLFLAVKEALNNAAKHSGATELFLRIHCPGAEVVVSMEDNGKGFDPAGVSAERNGLTNLTQRMAEIGGTCEVASKPGEGCRVTLRVPHSTPAPGWADGCEPAYPHPLGGW